MDEDVHKEAMDRVLKSMGAAAKSAKAKKFKRPVVEETSVSLSPVEGGATLSGLMGKKGNSAKDIVDENSPDADELEALLAQMTK